MLIKKIFVELFSLKNERFFLSSRFYHTKTKNTIVFKGEAAIFRQSETNLPDFTFVSVSLCVSVSFCVCLPPFVFLKIIHSFLLAAEEEGIMRRRKNIFLSDEFHHDLTFRTFFCIPQKHIPFEKKRFLRSSFGWLLSWESQSHFAQTSK